MHFSRRRTGFGLMEVLIGTAMFGGALGIMLYQQKTASRGLASVAGQQTLQSVRRFIRSFADCTQTLNPAPIGCATGDVIPVKKVDGSVLLSGSAPYTLIAGRFEIKANCSGNEFNIFVRPITDIPGVVKSTEWVDLMSGIPISCPSAPALPLPPGFPSQPSYCFNALTLPSPPTNIFTQTDLQTMSSNHAYILKNDIALSAGFTPLVGMDNITFDGQGHTIRNLNVNTPATNFVGLFKQLNCSKISNLTIDASTLLGNTDVGAMVGVATRSGFVNCTVTNTVNVTGVVNAAGLVGALSLQSLSDNNHSAAQVNGVAVGPSLAPFTVGGVVGTLQDSWDIGSSSTANVNEATIMISGLPSGGAAGGLFGTVSQSVVYNSTATVNVSGGQWAGGAIGLVTGNSFVVNVSTAGSVAGTITEIGGLVGRVTGAPAVANPVIWGCRSTASVTATTANAFSQTMVGGLVGWMDSGVLSLSEAKGVVTSRCGPAGGLIGFLSNNGTPTMPAQVSDSYATGNVINSDSCIWSGIGGLIGRHSFANSPVSNCYAVGAVSSPVNVGGFTGMLTNGAPLATNSFWDITTSGQAASVEGAGHTDAQMKVQATFTGFDFVSIWKILPISYPKFLWE